MKKYLCIILTVSILICTLPIGALTVSAAASGQCGDNAYWSFNQTNGVLNITGSGDMSNKYDLWTGYKSEIRTVYIASGITSIADDAFSFCDRLYMIEVPDTVNKIGKGAFSYCYELSSVIIPEGVKTIKESTFESTGLQYINIPNNITAIENTAFAYCYGIWAINIPKNVKSIASDAFTNCYNISTITVDSSNMVYSAKGNCLIEKASKTLILGCNYSTIPNDGSVTVIGDYAFNECYSLYGINIPDGLQKIGEGAFFGCANLGGIYIPDGVTSIGAGAFRLCSNLSYISIPDSVTYIGKDAFEYTQYHSLYNSWDNGVFYIGNNLLEVDTEKVGNVTVKEGTRLIGAGAFSACTEVTAITMPETVAYINDGAFTSCEKITEITIPSGVKNIGNEVFVYCYNLETINVSADNSVYHSSGNCLIETASKTLLVGCKNSIIPNDNSVEIIDDYAFCMCEISSVTIPNSVITIGEGAFAFTAITEIGIPTGVKSIGKNAFTFSPLDSVTISKTVESIGEQAFSYCTLNSITVDSGNKHYGDEGNNLIDKLTKTLIKGTSSSTIPTDGSVIAIGELAFLYCNELFEINIPNSVTSIGKGAFAYCTALYDIVLPDNVVIGESAFYQTGYYNDRDNWENNQILYIGNHLITSNYEIEGDYIVKEGTKTICDLAFLGQYYLEEVAIPQSVSHIGSNTFQGCYNLILLVYKDSYARQYAIDNNILYRLVDGVEGSWRKQDGKWWYRYSDATWAVGWAEIDDKWYYFDAAGWMKTGWLKSGGKWYYLGTSGAMVTDWNKIGGKWYYFNADGKMLTGWIKLGDTWYYLNSSGAMVTGSVTIGGKVYKFNSSGVWIAYKQG